jgi:ATP-binding cassette subfamily F protein uup
MKNPNFLILDEPTNDLDIKTLSILEEFVMDFPGTVIVVSHDRYFMDRVTETLVVFRGKGVIETYVGTYSSFLDVNSKVKNEKTQNKPISVIEEKEKNPPKLSNKEKKELDSIESEISKLETQKTTLTEKISNNSNYQEISQLTKDLEVIEGNIQKKLERWEYLSSK